MNMKLKNVVNALKAGPKPPSEQPADNLQSWDKCTQCEALITMDQLPAGLCPKCSMPDVVRRASEVIENPQLVESFYDEEDGVVCVGYPGDNKAILVSIADTEPNRAVADFIAHCIRRLAD